MRSIKLPLWIERILGLDPVQVPPHVFALSGDAIAYGSFHRGEAGYVFESIQRWELPSDLFSDGVLGGPLQEPRVFREQVRGFVDSLAGPIEAASLILPDTWLRLTFLELAEMPRKAREREEILRWKLKRLVPFRVEDLRIDPLEVDPFPSQEEPVRLLVGFGISMLISQIEDGFQAAGVEIGSITNATLATLASLQYAVSSDDLAALVMVQEDAYTLSYFRGGEPLLYRYKAHGEMARGALAGTVRRDLRMTAGFVQQHFPGLALQRAFLLAEPEAEDLWLSWLYDELEAPPEPLSFEHFQLTRTQVGPTWLQTAPLLGAASLEVR